MSFQTKMPIVSFFSLTNIVEKAIIIANASKGFCRLGYRTLLIDLDFDTPILFETLNISGTLEGESFLTTNEWLSNADMSVEEVVSQLLIISIGPGDVPLLTLSPCGVSTNEIQKWQTFQDKDIKKLFRRLTRLFRYVKKAGLFDIVLVNLPNNLNRASFPIMNSTFCFAISDHDLVSNALLRANLDAISGIHPLLKLSGVIIDKFVFEYPEKDQQESERIEEILLLPVISTLPSIRSEKYIKQDTLIDWSGHENATTQDLFDKLSRAIEGFGEKPRTIKKKEKTRFYSLFVVSTSGLPLFTHYFLPQQDTNEILASAGLSSLLTSVSAMIGEIVDRQDKTKLIELQKVKLIIEEWRNYKFILLTSTYEDMFREKLKVFSRSFMNSYTSKIKEFEKVSLLPSFDGIEVLIQDHFSQFIRRRG